MMRVTRIENHSTIGECAYASAKGYECHNRPKWIIEHDVVVIHDMVLHVSHTQSCDAHLSAFANYFMPKERK